MNKKPTNVKIAEKINLYADQYFSIILYKIIDK